jgi:Flp pilus assembly protein TadD
MIAMSTDAKKRANLLKAAHAAYEQRKFVEAEVIVRRLMREEASDLPARTLLAACLYKQGQVAEALDQVEVALQSLPEDEDLAVLRHIFMQALAAELWVSRRLCA